MLGDLANVNARFASVVADAVEWDDGAFIGSNRLTSSFVQLPDFRFRTDSRSLHALCGNRR